MKNIFLSYSRRDIRQAEELRQALLGQGYRPWMDANPGRGPDWRLEIDDAIQNADALIVVVTDEAANSLDITYEWAYAMGLGVPVFAILFQAAPVHPRLLAIETYDIGAWSDENHFWDYFLREFNRRMEQAPASIKSANPPLAPIPAYDKNVMPPAPGYWVVIRRGPMLNQMFRLDKNIVLLGRDAVNDIVINDPEVSHYHLRLLKQGDVYQLEDLDSTNGTRINGLQITGRVQLNDGDAIMLGDVIVLSYDLVYSS